MPTQYQGSQDEVRALCALINLMRAAEALSASLQREIADKRLTVSQFGILEALLHLGPVCQGELAGKLLRSCGSMTSVVAGLEKRGLVKRLRDGTDKRFVRVNLTDKGIQLIRNIFPKHAQTVARQFRVLSASEQETLRKLCRKLGTAVKEGDLCSAQ